MARISFCPELALVPACFLGLLVVQGHRADELLWTDELITLRNMSAGWIELVRDRYWAGHSPLYFALMKLWSLLLSGMSGVRPNDLSEWAVRLPSMIAMGMAGGFFAAAAWRAWAPICGLFFVPLWVLSPMVGRYFVEARPFSLLLLALSLGVWSSARLWSASDMDRAKKDSSMPILWILSITSPIFAAATIPVGIPAVVASELTAATLLQRSENPVFARRWRRRTILVIASVFVVLAALFPAIRHKSVDYWAEKVNPLSFESALQILNDVLTRKTHWISLILCFLAAVGLYTRRNDFLGRTSAGLALVFPLFMIALSSIKSLLVSRYFFPIIPGFFLLAVGSISERFNIKALSVISALLLVAFMLPTARPLQRVQVKQAQQQLAALKGLRIDSIEGGVTHPHLKTILEHYIPRSLHVPVRLRIIDKPLKTQDLPTDRIFWLFDHRKNRQASRWIGDVKLICHFSLKSSEIYVAARRIIESPFDVDECDGKP